MAVKYGKKRYRASSAPMKKRKVNANYSAAYNMVVPTRTSMIARGVPRGPVPRYMRTVLRYAEQTFTLDPGLSGASTAYVFTANGLFDPNITGVGHQPRGFDQYMGLYNYYTCVASRIVLRASPAASETLNLMVGLCPLNNSTANSDSIDYLESQGCLFEFLRPGTSSAAKKLQNEVDLKSWYDVKSPVDDESLRGNNGTNPSRQVYWHVWASAITSSGNPTALECTVLIEYDVIFSGPNEVTSS